MYGSCKVHKIVLMVVRLSCQYYLLCKHPVTKLGNSLVPILEPLTINKCTVQDQLNFVTEILNETSLREKEDFYSHLNMEDITAVDYAHTKRVYEDFEIKTSERYHHLHVQSDTFLLADAFGNFRNMFLELYELDPAKFIPAPGFSWQAPLKNTKVKLDLLTDIDMLLMVEKGIREGICNAIQ